MYQQFEGLFRSATDGYAPFGWQERLATDPDLPQVIKVPTGAGKTEGASLGWLWRRRFADPATRAHTPRRLVYCLPMRTLVEQTVTRIAKQHERLGLAIPVHQLMGGAVQSDWVDHPEHDAVLVGTLDQLFSRALMRGYGESRFRWPIDYGLLHTDCLWVLDEVQLFGEALATSAQIEGIRRRLPPGPASAFTIWMSATVEPAWIATVDHPEPSRVLEIDDMDRTGDLAPRLEAEKRLSAVPVIDAAAVAANHRPGTLTLVVLNTVRAARDLTSRLRRDKSLRDDVDILLLHSRFRPPDRRAISERLTSEPPPAGRIVVATQVVEAGVDLSAATLFTHSAPWASLVQRFGRCNRRGEIQGATILWAPPDKPLPYDEDEVRAAEEALRMLEGTSVGPAALEVVDAPLAPPLRRHVLRKRDFLGLFDTAPDLSGLDLDISRFVRDTDDMTAGIAWRELGVDRPGADAAPLARDELCPASLSELNEAMKRAKTPRAYRFDHIEERWQPVDAGDVRPGDRLLSDVTFGCYSADGGFDPKAGAVVESVTSHLPPQDEGVGQDVLTYGRGVWLSLADHTNGVCEELEQLLATCPELTAAERAALRRAARLHDWGKAHPVFQDALRGDGEGVPPSLTDELLAKRVGRGVRYARRGFRHELASALAYLGDPEADPLVAYLIASHHGRVRLGARAVPGEGVGQKARSVLGCEDGDVLPEADLGGGERRPESHLGLSPLELGTRDGETYADMALAMLDELGPVRLAYLEAILRTADRRRSAREQELSDA